MRNSNTDSRNKHILRIYAEWKRVNSDLPDTWFVRNYLRRERNIFISSATFKRVKSRLSGLNSF